MARDEHKLPPVTCFKCGKSTRGWRAPSAADIRKGRIYCLDCRHGFD